ELRRDDFIGIASHELKTPVTTIKAFTQILQKRFDNKEDEASRYLVKMDRQLNRLTELIGDLLDVSKIQFGKLALRLERFKINDLVSEIVEDIGQTSERHKIIAILARIEGHVVADRERIGQILVNFLTNAIKYSPDADKII